MKTISDDLCAEVEAFCKDRMECEVLLSGTVFRMRLSNGEVHASAFTNSIPFEKAKQKALQAFIKAELRNRRVEGR